MGVGEAHCRLGCPAAMWGGGVQVFLSALQQCGVWGGGVQVFLSAQSDTTV